MEGGSTLTQQLAKNMFLTPERSLKRKVQEVVLAVWLETKYSKDEILELYLNRVYFGAGAYGVDAAARRYFDRDAAEPSCLPQVAMLAGLLPAPKPLCAEQESRSGRKSGPPLVLAAMREQGYSIAAAGRDRQALDEPARAAFSPPLAMSRQRKLCRRLGHGGCRPSTLGSARWSRDVVVETTADLGAAGRRRTRAAPACSAHAGVWGRNTASREGAMVVVDGPPARCAPWSAGAPTPGASSTARSTPSGSPASAFKPFVEIPPPSSASASRPDTVRIDRAGRALGSDPRRRTRPTNIAAR